MFGYFLSESVGYVNNCHISTFLCVNCGGQKHLLEIYGRRCGIFLINGSALLVVTSSHPSFNWFSLFWDSITSSYSYFLRVHGSNGSNVFRGAVVLAWLKLHWLLLFQIFSFLISWIYGSWNNIQYGPNQSLSLLSYGCLYSHKGIYILLHFRL